MAKTTIRTPAVNAALQADEPLLAPMFPAWDPCSSAELGLMRATITELDVQKDPALGCITELLKDCLRDGYISPDRRTSLIASIRTVKESANQECVALIVQLLTLPVESEDLSRVLVLRNYLEHAQVSFTTFKQTCQGCSDNWLQAYVWKDLVTTNDTVSGRITTALQRARDLCALQVSCDCAVEMRRCLDALREAFRELERGCCLLLCEFNRGQMFEDACYAVLEARFFEGLRFIASASRTLKNVSGLPRSVGPEAETIQRMVTELKRKPKLSDHVLAELGRLESGLSLFGSHGNSQAGRAMAIDLMETADGLSCHREIEREIARIVGALFTLVCRASQGATSRTADELNGFDLDFPEEVSSVQARDLVTGETRHMTPINGRLQVPQDSGRMMEFTTFDAQGLRLDSVTLQA